jgi:prolyl oligopeptidase
MGRTEDTLPSLSVFHPCLSVAEKLFSYLRSIRGHLNLWPPQCREGRAMLSRFCHGLAALALLAVSSLAAAEAPLRYPTTRRVDQVDVYHGVAVADPYRWLEADIRTSPAVADWVAAENQLTAAYLDAIPQRETIRRRLTDLWNFAQYAWVRKEGGRYYSLKNDGLQNQSVLYVMDSLDATPRVLLDPNRWSKDGTIALTGLGFSDDGKYLAYSRSEAGSDWSTWYILEIATGRILPDTIQWTKFSQASWTQDGKGFFYSRFQEPGRGAEFQSLNFNNKLYYHRVGTAQSADALVYWRPDHPQWQYDGTVSDDGRYLVVSAVTGTDQRQRILVRDLTEPYAMPVELVDNFEHEYTFVGNDGPTLFFKTDRAAPRRRLVAVDLRRPGPPHWREIIPQSAATLTQVALVGGRFLAVYLKDVAAQAREFSLDGRFLREIALPGIGTVAGFEGRPADAETFYSFSSIATPPSIYRYDIAAGTSRLIRRAEVKFKPEDYEVRQVFYRSKDGTRVPMFVAYKKGIRLDGSNPTLLYGYGGFNISLLPMFSIARVAWMEMGGVYAQPNLRGGGEYGEAWHDAGRKLKKQNVFDDFIAAAEWLIAEKYTRPDKLAIQGGSNGGLLVGAVETQRPDLFGACLPAVGVMDMLRFARFTEGRMWVDDYGSTDDPQQFKTLLAYSPYHNIRAGTRYPATLIATADTDDRVVPGHSFKFAAALQHAQAGSAAVLIRITARAGHGPGKPVRKRIEEVADDWAFLVKNLGMTLPSKSTDR